MSQTEITIYLHGDKDGLFYKGQQAGLVGEALSKFSYACSEVEVTLAVDESTGESSIVAVDGRPLQ